MSFLVVPMQGAVLQEDIKISDDLEILVGDFEDKKEKLSCIVTLNQSSVDEIMQHTKDSRNEDFFKSPIFIYKTNFNDIIDNWPLGIYKVKYLTGIINIIYYAYVYPKHKINVMNYMVTKRERIKEYRPDVLKKNNYMLIIDEKSDYYKLFPLRLDYGFNFELDWIKGNKKLKEYISEFVKIINDNDILVRRLKTAISIFYKSIVINEKREEYFLVKEMDSDCVLFLHTALECLILIDSNEKDKSLKIRKYISKKFNHYNINKNYNDMFNFIRYMTNSRGKYVHQGDSYNEKNMKPINDILKDNEHLNDLEILTQLVARTIIESMKVIIKIKENKIINEEEYEKKYFEEIDRVISQK